MEENMRFQGTDKNLDTLSAEIAKNLGEEGYEVQSNKAPSGIVIQAKKGGVLRDIITADRAFTIMITGKPNDFTVRVGIGKMAQNLAVAAAETLILSELFLAIDVPEMLWTKHVENGLIKDIQDIVGAKPVEAKIKK